jgi:proline iminopeptidase
VARGAVVKALAFVVLAACAHTAAAPSAYFSSTAPDAWAGGVRVLPLHTPKGDFHVWTKRVGNNPRIKVLLLTGGPGASHEIWEALDSYFPAADIEYYYYDQLGTGFSDRPDDDSLWDVPRYVDEVEQVRTALGLDRDNFYVLGWSWGGILAMEYALKYQQHIKGLIISDMMASIPAYNDYATRVLEPAMDPKALAEIKQLEADGKFDDPRYDQLLFENFYTQHILRRPIAEWPWTVVRAFETLNKTMYRLMQGPSEMGASGRLEHWDRFADLHTITVPTLVIGGKYDTMDPAYLEKMAHEMPKARHVTCPNGSHMSLYDDQQVYTSSVIQFIEDVDQGRM